MPCRIKIGAGSLSKAKNNKIAFLDRDGIVNVDHGYVFLKEDFQFVEGFLDLFRALINLDYTPVVITNQSGVARGLFTLADVGIFHDHINECLKEKTGSTIHSFHICPHHPNFDRQDQPCVCRKPSTGLIDDFLEKNRITNLSNQSFMLGDKKSDVELGLRKNLRTFQLDTGKYPVNSNADLIVKDLKDIIVHL